MRPRLTRLITIVFLCLATGSHSFGADHREAPLLDLDPSADLRDIYAFVNPANPSTTVFVLTVAPAVTPEGGFAFYASEYKLVVDNTFDQKPDVRLSLSFAEPDDSGVQAFVVRVQRPNRGRKEPTATRRFRGVTGVDLDLPGGGRVRADIFDDPFFFDLQALIDQTGGTGDRRFCDGRQTDFFAGTDVAGMVLEVPTRWLMADATSFHVWAEARAGRTIDRMGNPGLNTLYVPGEARDRYNKTKPRQHVHKWSDIVEETLLLRSNMGTDPYDAREAAAIAGILLPDVLTLDTASSDGYVPNLNGRRVDDDVMDYQLSILTGGYFDGKAAVDSDCVDRNDVDLPREFPYLAPRHSR
jgi:hypothetical protein